MIHVKFDFIWIVSCSWSNYIILLLMFEAEKVLLLLVISLTVDRCIMYYAQLWHLYLPVFAVAYVTTCEMWVTRKDDINGCTCRWQHIGIGLKNMFSCINLIPVGHVLCCVVCVFPTVWHRACEIVTCPHCNSFVKLKSILAEFRTILICASKFYYDV